jgi:TrmH family RNA methyltransferase
VLSKNKIKYILSLQRKKVRRDTGCFLVEGDKMVRELLEQRPDLVESIFALPEWIAPHQPLLTRRKMTSIQNPASSAIPRPTLKGKPTRMTEHFEHSQKITVEEITDKELQQISTLQTPNQVLAIARQPKPPELPPDFDHGLSLYLDGIQDPGNMGTILRIADWFGIQMVICSATCVEVYSPKVVQATMGAIFRVVTLTENLVNLTERFANLPVYGTLLEGENLYQAKLGDKGIIVIGNEGAGISAENVALVTRPISIPQGQGSHAESLNAAVATGIVCAFFCKTIS